MIYDIPEREDPSLHNSYGVRWRSNSTGIVEWRRAKEERPPLILLAQVRQLVEVEQLPDRGAPSRQQNRVQMPLLLRRRWSPVS